MKYVFVCRHGEYRSPVAAAAAEEYATEQKAELVTETFGVSDSRTALEKMRLLSGANRVYIMEEHMRFDIERALGYRGPVVCLNVPDIHLTAEEIASVVRSHLDFSPPAPPEDPWILHLNL